MVLGDLCRWRQRRRRSGGGASLLVRLSSRGRSGRLSIRVFS